MVVPNIALPPSVTTGVLTDLPTSPTVFTSREGREPSTVCLIQTFFFRNEGKLQLPVSGPCGTKSEIVELTAPWGLKFVSWVVARHAMLPELPKFEALASLNETLAGWIIVPVAPGIMIDGVTYEFGATGTYAYYLSLPPDLCSGLPIGRQNFDSSTGKILTDTNFTDNWRGLAPNQEKKQFQKNVKNVSSITSF